jgi:predicted amidophosphoribosyltransferase
VLDALFTTVFPLVCPGCGRRGDPVCARCGAALSRAPSTPPPAGIDAWWAAFAYEGVAREVVARVKYRGARAAVPWLADAMVAAMFAARSDGQLAVDVVTWAPTSRDRRRARGFDPAELLARAVARQLVARRLDAHQLVARRLDDHVDVRCVGLLDRRTGPPQTGLTGADRRRGPGHVARRASPPSVLVVDDVATTGATLTAAALALRAAGARDVFACTAARTPPPARP